MSQLIIEAGCVERHYWRDLWRYRELFFFLAWRDFLVKYKQTVVGVAWSLLKPLLTMLVLTVVFGRFGRMPSGGVPYPVLVFCGMLPWQFFSNALSESGGSLVNNANLISKIYFPRLVVPASSIITSLVDFGISGCFLIILMVLVLGRSSRPDLFPACLHPACLGDLLRRRRLDRGAHGRVSRLPRDRPIYCPVRPLSLPGGIYKQHCASAVSPSLFHESNGRCD